MAVRAYGVRAQVCEPSASALKRSLERMQREKQALEAQVRACACRRAAQARYSLLAWASRKLKCFSV